MSPRHVARHVLLQAACSADELPTHLNPLREGTAAAVSPRVKPSELYSVEGQGAGFVVCQSSLAERKGDLRGPTESVLALQTEPLDRLYSLGPHGLVKPTREAFDS
jgi:hypothetical protein